MIRLAGTGDIPLIVALMKSVAGFWDESWRQDVLERVLGSSGTIALVHEDDTIDGFVCGHDVGFRAYLSELVVSPPRKGEVSARRWSPNLSGACPTAAALSLSQT